MSTRAQIRVIVDGQVFSLYHHCDGYFTGVGQELHEALLKHKNEKKPNIYADEVLYELYRKGGYEPTTMIHGDIEYFYILDFDNKDFSGVRITDSFSNRDYWKDWDSFIPSGDEINLLNPIKED